MQNTAYTFKELPKRYDELVDILAPRPIHTESEYDEVVEIMDVMVGHKLNKDQDDYLDALTRFVQDYDNEHYPIPDPTPLEMLEHLMERRDMTVSDLGRVLGDRSTASRVLSGQRDLSKAHIRKLANYFGVSTDLFLAA